jgi:hypothetical protein
MGAARTVTPTRKVVPNRTEPAGRTKAGSQPRRDSPSKRNPPDEQEWAPNRGARDHHRTKPAEQTKAGSQPRRLFPFSGLAQTTRHPVIAQSFCIIPIRAFFESGCWWLSRYSFQP